MKGQAVEGERLTKAGTGEKDNVEVILVTFQATMYDDHDQTHKSDWSARESLSMEGLTCHFVDCGCRRSGEMFFWDRRQRGMESDQFIMERRDSTPWDES